MSFASLRYNLKKFKGEVFYTFGNFYTPLVAIANGAIAAAFIGPDQLGIINTVMLTVPYLAFLQLGVFNGLNRNLALYKSMNEPIMIKRFVNASYRIAKINSVIGICVGVGYLAYYLIIRESSIYLFATLLLIITLGLSPLTSHYDTTYRSSQDFSKLGRILFKENTLYGILSLLPIFIGFYGKIISNAVRVLLRFIFRSTNPPVPSSGKGNLQDIIELIRVGAPLLVGGYLLSIFIITDQTIIAHFLGTKQLGLYSLSVMIITALSYIPISLNIMLYPKAATSYGTYKSGKYLKRFFWNSLLLNIAILFPISSILYITITPLTNLFFPEYIEGLPAARISILTCLTYISIGPSVIVGVVRRNQVLILLNALCIILMWGYASTTADILTLNSIAWLRFIISFLMSIVTLIYCYYLTTQNDFRK